MPLLPGKQNVSRNIRELYHANESKSKPRPRAQIIAIALSKIREGKK